MRTVCGGEFQADGAENWKATREKLVFVNSWTSSRMAAGTFHDSVIQVSRSGRAPNFVRQNCQLYVIHCWTGNQCSWCSNSLEWIFLTTGAQSELHYPELTAVSGWCRWVCHEAQHCSSQSWTESGYMLTSVLTPSIKDV